MQTIVQMRRIILRCLTWPPQCIRWASLRVFLPSPVSVLGVRAVRVSSVALLRVFCISMSRAWQGALCPSLLTPHVLVALPVVPFVLFKLTALPTDDSLV
ncbi:hypothetical protein XELAEV_18041937mg [Xenopus laevis]|uniref:Uncharacterized protein n=1 Tax=Xenopus laevis TaxID=8355 RepID=A0A974C328_XENLA|nr:hypothetical protein XELAEV_18041937mg [Xenopus laevis]